MERKESPDLIERRFFLGQAVAAAVISYAHLGRILARSGIKRLDAVRNESRIYSGGQLGYRVFITIEGKTAIRQSQVNVNIMSDQAGGIYTTKRD